jgi:DNA polymerase zeta
MGGASSNFTKRHTSLMLEADSRVEGLFATSTSYCLVLSINCATNLVSPVGIINEKHKVYTSLSQTTTYTKMVQSLLAIWEVSFLLYVHICCKLLLVAKPL